MPRPVYRKATDVLHRNAVVVYLAIFVAMGWGFYRLGTNQEHTQQVASQNSVILTDLCATTVALANLDRFFLNLAIKIPPNEKPPQRRIRLMFVMLVRHDLATVRDTEQTCKPLTKGQQ